MKRRQQTPRVLVALGEIAGLTTFTSGTGLAIGAGTTRAADPRLAQYGALA